MANSYKEVVFHEHVYLLIASHGENDGPLATPAQYENGESPFAHLYPDGTIKRYGTVIGSRDDLTFTGKEATCRPSAAAFAHLMGFGDCEEEE